MKRIININISKDTPEETLTALHTALKKENEKSRRKQPLYALNEDIEKLHERYEQLFKQVKTSLNLSETQIEKECETLSRKYDFELEELSELRKVEYDKRQAEIKAREAEQTPWRRCWLWRLLGQPLTNRAQDIIEARAELEADIKHTADENAIENDRKKLKQDDGEKLSVRKLKRIMRDELKAVIKRADNADVQEAFTEPANAAPVPKNPDTVAPANDVESAPDSAGQLPGQMQMRLNELQRVPARRPRPPRSCRKP